MAMVRSSMVKTVRRALSVCNPQPLRRNHGVPASNSTRAPHEVRWSKKANNSITLSGYTIYLGLALSSALTSVLMGAVCPETR